MLKYAGFSDTPSRAGGKRNASLKYVHSQTCSMLNYSKPITGSFESTNLYISSTCFVVSEHSQHKNGQDICFKNWRWGYKLRGIDSRHKFYFRENRASYRLGHSAIIAWMLPASYARTVSWRERMNNECITSSVGEFNIGGRAEGDTIF